MTGQQFDLFDYAHDGSLNIGAQYTLEGFTNRYDRMPDHDCMVDVIDHEGNRFKTRAYVNKFGYPVFDATKGKGYDICWWKEIYGRV